VECTDQEAGFPECDRRELKYYLMEMARKETHKNEEGFENVKQLPSTVFTPSVQTLTNDAYDGR
jgi:hypothetical protein